MHDMLASHAIRESNEFGICSLRDLNKFSHRNNPFISIKGVEEIYTFYLHINQNVCSVENFFLLLFNSKTIKFFFAIFNYI